MKPEIAIVGLGPGPARYLTLETRDLLMGDAPVYLRTAVHPTVTELKSWGCAYTSFDPLYEEARDFESLYAQITHQLFSEAQAHGRIVYAVPGNPLVAESTVTRLLANAEASGVTCRLHTAVSCLDVIFEAIGSDPTDGVQILDGLSLSLEQLHLDQPLLITQVYSPAVATEVKLMLLERLDPAFLVTVIRAAGCDDQQISQVTLEELDRLSWIDHLTSVYIPAAPPESQHPLQYLRYVVARLRNPEGGCPWDLQQTPQSLRKYVLEEAYEVVDALDSEDPEAICEELGDLLLQVFLQSQVAQDQGDFDLDEVALGIANKLVYRHPHVFGDAKVTHAEDVKLRWEELKAREKAAKGSTDTSVLANLTLSLPALSLAEKIGRKVAQVGFEWSELSGVRAKIDEELAELDAACEANQTPEIQHELGDVLFTLVNLARWYQLDPEDALRQANLRFIFRFKHMEQHLQGRSLREISAENWEQLWEQAKQATTL
ncbi:MAG: nucleoside triphosphate pyrophosphohydrolase [Candidatus Sericytochromatia bacterium]